MQDVATHGFRLLRAKQILLRKHKGPCNSSWSPTGIYAESSLEFGPKPKKSSKTRHHSYEWINGQKPHLIKDGIRIICNTENFVPIVVPGLSSSSSASSSTSRTPMKQESHSSSSSSTSSSSPTVNEIQSQERGDRIESDISPVQVSNSVDDRSGQPDDETQANKTPKTNKKETTIERGDTLWF